MKFKNITKMKPYLFKNFLGAITLILFDFLFEIKKIICSYSGALYFFSSLDFY